MGGRSPRGIRRARRGWDMFRAMAALVVILTGCSPEPPCPRGSTLCDDRCVDTNLDPDHCGSCATSCAGGSTCRAGSCVAPGCAPGMLACADTCVDPLTNNEHCGATGACTADSAGVVCGPTRFCSGGLCLVRCPTGFLACQGGCIDPAWDSVFCGARGDCSATDVNSSNWRGEFCTDLTICINGGCTDNICTLRGVSCGGACVDPLTDPNHCGARGYCQDADPRSTNFQGSRCPTMNCIGGQCAP